MNKEQLKKAVKKTETLKHCSEVTEEKCKGLEELFKKEIDKYLQIADATYEALIWYYYCYSVGDILSCLDEKFSEPVKAIVTEYFGSLSNYADFLKENLNL